ncbi:MAG: hypothetical protein O7H39_07990 [Gammaproteobacteria bacterium]|nr:hypothetical protein [Gammaproteobacteria bacterium]
MTQAGWWVDTRPLFLLMALVCAAVLAEEAREQSLPADYMDRIREQIYEDASDDWRSEKQQTESGWRTTLIIEEKRSRFGYDPEFDERLHRAGLGDYDRQRRLGEPEPNTVFRIGLD